MGVIKGDTRSLDYSSYGDYYRGPRKGGNIGTTPLDPNPQTLLVLIWRT